MKLNLRATNVFQRNYDSKKRIAVNQGGTGSSKSYSLAQLFVVLAHQHTGATFSIVRKSMPTLRSTAMRDFINILKDAKIYNEDNHRKTENVYQLNGNEIEFFGLDEPQKVRSRRRDYLWINEANELELEAFRQLNMRTNKKVYLDFNPSDEFHWIYDHVLTRKDSELIVSTYKDNPFLPPEIIHEIELYREHDENYWKVYGLGERGASNVRVFTKYFLIDQLPKEGEKIYGLDFGYNNATALTRIVINDQDLYLKQVIYQTHLTNTDLIALMNEMKISKTMYIYADSEDPNRIEELQQAGFNVIGTQKGKDSVKAGIDMMKRRRIYVTKDSAEGIKELQTYSWKVKGDIVLDEPVKLRDHFLDSVRGAVYTHNIEAEAEYTFI